MKLFQLKAIFLLIAVCVTCSSMAQTLTTTGTVEWGGEMSYTSQSVSNYRESTSIFSFNPYIGVMAGHGLEIGIKGSILSGEGGSALGVYGAPSFNFNTKSNVY